MLCHVYCSLDNHFIIPYTLGKKNKRAPSLGSVHHPLHVILTMYYPLYTSTHHYKPPYSLHITPTRQHNIHYIHNIHYMPLSFLCAFLAHGPRYISLPYLSSYASSHPLYTSSLHIFFHNPSYIIFVISTIPTTHCIYRYASSFPTSYLSHRDMILHPYVSPL